MSIIWIFREPRSGSTAFSELVSAKLGIPHKFVPVAETHNHPQPNNYVLSTHSFEALQYMNMYSDPILIRCTRRDKAEQCLSHLMLRHIHNKQHNNKYSFSNIFTDKTRNTHMHLIDNASPTIITKKEVTDYLELQQQWNLMWNLYSSKFRNLTVYYEDLCDRGSDMSILGLGVCNIRDSSTVKIPEYKSKIFLNADMVKKWISSECQ